MAVTQPQPVPSYTPPRLVETVLRIKRYGATRSHSCPATGHPGAVCVASFALQSDQRLFEQALETAGMGTRGQHGSPFGHG